MRSTPNCWSGFPWPKRGHSKISNLELDIFGEKNVGRFEIQMNDSSLVNKSESLKGSMRICTSAGNMTYVTEINNYLPYSKMLRPIVERLRVNHIVIGSGPDSQTRTIRFEYTVLHLPPNCRYTREHLDVRRTSRMCLNAKKDVLEHPPPLSAGA